MPKSRTILLAAFLGIALLAGGCSSFNRDWKSAVTTPDTGAISGAWEGRWHSDDSGHEDRLRCIIRPDGPGAYQARFRANYRKIIHFSYTVKLTGAETNGLFHFRGEANLGRMAGGVYSYEGDASATNFFSTYRCRYDHGTFQMGRPK